MELKLTRRRLGQLAIASTATAAIGYVANRTLAQTPSLIIYGLQPNRKAGGAIVQSLDVVTKEIKNVTTVILQRGERFGGFTSLTDGTFVVVISPVRASKRENNPSRLVFLNTSSTTLELSGLTKQETLEDLLVLNDGSLAGLVIRKNKRFPRLVGFDFNTGDVLKGDRIKLPSTTRYDNLTQLSNGAVITTAVGDLGDTTLVQLNLGQKSITTKAKLNFNGKQWDSGLSSLTTSPADQLFALGGRRYETPYNLYTVDVNTGKMTLIREWDVAEITVV